MSVGEAILVETTAYPVTAFEDCYLEAMLKEDIGAAKASQAGAYYPNMWTLTILLLYVLISVQHAFHCSTLFRGLWPDAGPGKMSLPPPPLSPLKKQGLLSTHLKS